MRSIDLTGKWKFRGGPPGAAAGVSGIARWMSAEVPGTVHTDLMAAGKIPDPFYRMNENDVQWIDRVGWVYRRSFTVPRSILDEPVIELVAEGLDTYAEIWVNGITLGTVANMFIPHRFSLVGLLRAGRNTIEIRFDSPTLRAEALEREHGRLQVALEPHRVYARKAQYSFGWDWGPKLTTSGIWLPIRIEAYRARLRDPFVRLLSAGALEAEFDIEVGVERWEDGGLTLDVRIAGEEGEISCPVDRGKMTVRRRLANPRLWWPNGFGEQALYHAEMILRRGDEVLQSLRFPFALRTVRLVQVPDEEGRSFIFEVNGTRIFCKGADWIPADTFLPRAAEKTYEKLLTMARDASMNMIRVWGGGIYEKDVFYDLCDRLGLMVWQDFMYACGEYPDHPSFLEEARHEAELTVKRLRNHPAIVLWCGNNECEWIFCTGNPGKGPDAMRGSAIFRDVLPAVVQEFDGTRPYWRSTPFGEGFPNAQENGNHHQWEVWSMWKDYTLYRQDNARFVSEFGFQGPAGRRTIESVLAPGDRSPQSLAMVHHNKQVEGTERIFKFLSGHYRVTGEWEGFLYTGQLLQAEALKCAVEHWRRRKFRTAGALFWQLNDCWPVTSWSVIDSALRPKAAYYAARRFFAPLLVSFAPVEGGLEVWGTSDFLTPVEGRLNVRLQTFGGKVRASTTMPLRLPANSSERLFAIPAAWRKKGGDYMRAEITDRGRPISVNRFLFAEPKDCAFPTARVRVGLEKLGPASYRAVLSSNVFALGVVLSSPGNGVQFHDNFVDLDAGVAHEIAIASRLSLARLRKSLTVKALNGETANQ
jgi:beta-mannosidase